MKSTPQISIIVACTRDLAIGRGGDLLYHIREDLRRFKALTMGAPIIMGRKTFESLPLGPLPGRRNIVVTRNPDFDTKGAERASSLTEAVKMCADAQRVFVIGGGEIYREALEIADDVELTLIDAVAPDADTFFSPFDPSVWILPAGFPDNVEFDRVDPLSSVVFTFLTLTRKNLNS